MADENIEHSDYLKRVVLEKRVCIHRYPDISKPEIADFVYHYLRGEMGLHLDSSDIEIKFPIPWEQILGEYELYDMKRPSGKIFDDSIDVIWLRT